MRFIRLFLTAILGLTTLVLSTPNVAAAAEPAFEGTRSETFTVGPYSLAPQGQPGDQVNQIFAALDRPEGDIAVHEINWSLVDGDGNEVAPHQAHLHHLVMLDSARPDALCGVPSRFAGTGRELIDFEMPEGYAYFSPEGQWQGVYHLMNISAAPIDLAVEYTVTYSDAAASDALDVEPFFLDVDGCWGDSEYVVPGDGGPDSIHEASNQYVMERDATLVAGGGHLHPGGIDVTLSEVDGPEICRAIVTGGHGGHHDSDFDLEPCGLLDYDVEIGDTLDLTARYRNHTLIPDAMGIMVMYLHFTSPPPPPPTVEITSVQLSNGALEVSVVCNRTFVVDLYGSVRQTKGNASINGYGYTTERPLCSPDGVTVSLELMGDGVLTGGNVDYTIEAYGSTGRDFVSDLETGSTRLRGRVDLGAIPQNEGDLDIVIDPEIDADDNGNPVVHVSVPCSDAIDGEVSVQIRQRVGRQYIYASGYNYGNSSCTDGFADFSITIEYSSGRLAGGPVTVTASAYLYSENFEYGTRTATAHLSGTTRPVDTTRDFTTDPSSRVSINEVVRSDGTVIVRATLTGCRDGAQVYFDASLAALGGRGRRVSGQDAYAYNQESITCSNGDAIEVDLETYGDLSGNRVGVQIYAYEELFVDDNYESEFSTNAGEFRIR